MRPPPLYLVLPLEVMERHLILQRPEILAVVSSGRFQWRQRAVLPPPLSLVKLPLRLKELQLILPRPEAPAVASSPCLTRGRRPVLPRC